jgi:hypothetical protein
MKSVWMALVSACAIGGPMHSTAANEAVTLTIENDTFTGSDNNYTNGIGLTWVSRDLKTYGDESLISKWGRFWSFLPFVSDEGYTTYATWSVAQEMHTPHDITGPNPPEDDQPYAGILYVDSVLYMRKERWPHARQLKLGVVGPSSHADSVQKDFHEFIGADEPLGWHTQLPDEPVMLATRSRTYWPEGIWVNRLHGESFPWPPRVSAITSPVSDSVYTARSAGTSWMPWAERLCVQSSMQRQRSV